MTIHPIAAFEDNYIWCLVQGENCAIIDPGDAEPVIAFLTKEKLHLTAILITHHHYDHTNGIKALVDFEPVPVYGPARIPEVTHLVSSAHPLELEPIGMKFNVLEIPGHTLEHVAYYAEGIVFTGDTLFTGGCGRIFEGTPPQMYHSLQLLKTLPDETMIFCGHEYTESNLEFAVKVDPENPHLMARLNQVKNLRSQRQPTANATLHLEKLTNPFLRCDHADIITAVSRYQGRPSKDLIETFAALREWKNELSY